MVMVYLFSFEGNNDKVKEALKFFRDVKEDKHQQWANVPAVLREPVWCAWCASTRSHATSRLMGSTACVVQGAAPCMRHLQQ